MPAPNATIQGMRGALESWLKYRRVMDTVASGKAVKAALPAPGLKVVPDDAAALRAERYADEQRLATRLHNLLGEMFDPQALPGADVKADPEAAVKLAEIAISGKLPSEAASAPAQGFIWLWPVLLVGGVVLVLSSVVRSLADVAKEKERLRCIQAGACTDSGFWLKAGSVVFLGWFAWEKLGVGARFEGRGRRRRY
jgi:hypothetical protein